jgi:hypothetical protein
MTQNPVAVAGAKVITGFPTPRIWGIDIAGKDRTTDRRRCGAGKVITPGTGARLRQAHHRQAQQ